MSRSTLALALVVGSSLAAAACTNNSDRGRVVTAPVAQVAPQGAPSAAAGASSAPASASGSAPTPGAPGSSAAPPVGLGAPPGAGAGNDAGIAAFQACQSDSDCVAVPRNGCCQNGWNEAVNVAQQDAYKQSFTCPPPRPMCPMFRVRDSRVPRCVSQRCTMVK